MGTHVRLPCFTFHAKVMNRSVLRADHSISARKEKETHMNTESQLVGITTKPVRAKSVLAGLLVGGLVGAGTMLLFAPQPGAKTRTELQQGAIRLRDQTSETVKGKVVQVKTRANQIKADVIIKVGDLRHHGQDLVMKQLDRLSHAAETGKKALQESQEHKVA
jgi:gas vesicle protein